jgi:hypothetical protein
MQTSRLLLTDVVPALDATESEWAELLSGVAGLGGLNPSDVPAEWLITEFLADRAICPPIALSVGKLIVSSAGLARAPLGSIVPEVVRAPPLESSAYAGPDILRIARQVGITHWTDLAGWTPGRLTLTLSKEEAILVVTVAIREAAVGALSLARCPRRRSADVRGAIALVATWASYELGLDQVGAALEAVRTESRAPVEVTAAMELLRNQSLDQLVDGDVAAYDLTGALRRILACDERSRRVLKGRVYHGASRPTLDELGIELGVTRERVRQIEQQLKKKIDGMLGSGEFDVIKRGAERLRERLGLTCRIADVPDEVAWARGLRSAPTDEAALHARVLLQLAGQYTEREVWLVREPAAEVFIEDLQSRTAEAPTSLHEITGLLTELDLHPDDHVAWLERICKCRVIDGTVVPWTGSMADKAAALMQIRGVPITPDEIAEVLGPDTNHRSMINQIQSDARFLRRGLKHYGLAAWGGEEYTKISEEIEQELERQGGSATIDHLVRTLCEQFGVSEASVRAYAGSAPFVKTDDGRITIGVGEITFARRPIEDCRGCFRVAGRWALRIVVDSELLRGSGRPVPVGIPQLLGIRPDEDVRLVTPFGDLHLRYARQATIGSLRTAALRLGCGEGDRLFVIFTGGVAADFHAVALADIDDLRGAERLAREVGGDPSGDPISVVADALGLEPDDYRVSAVRRRLVARKEEDLFAMVAGIEDADADDDVLGQLAGLGG